MLQQVLSAQEVEGGEGGVEMKVEALGVAALPVGEACELLGVAKEELDLEARGVQTHHLRPAQGSTCQRDGRSAGHS